MSFHLVAWRVSAADGTATDMTPVTDPIMTVSNGHFLPQRDMPLLFASFSAASATRARLISPTFRQVTTPWIRPMGVAIVQGVEAHIADYRANPLRVRGLEELQMEGTQTSGGAAIEVATAGLQFSPMALMPGGDVYTLRGTATTTLTAGGWTQVTMTWQDTLPAGQYVVVGMEYVGATAIAARLVFEEQTERPGCVGAGLGTSQQHAMFDKGGLGVWGRFNANRMPNVECLANAADTAEEIFLDIIRIA